jgi:hypothetical protein
MSDPVLCLVTLFFLAWVIYLKWQMGALQKRMDELSQTVKTKLKGVDQGMEVGK